MIDPRQPDYSNTPVTPSRPKWHYVPRDPHAPPEVTVITPFYNIGTVFHETAQCVFDQSLQQWEWLIINDGSTDPESLAILNNYRNRDPRIRVIDQPHNHGPSAARNCGFTEAQALLIFQLDGDDLIEPTTLEKCLWYLVSHPKASFVKGLTVGFGSEQYLWTQGFDARRRFFDENLATVTAMIRRKVHTSVGGFDETICDGMEDWDFWVKCADRGFWGDNICEFLDWYRRRPNAQRDWEDIIHTEKRKGFRQELRQRYEQLYRNKEHFQIPSDPDDLAPAENFTLDLPFDNHLANPQGRPRLLMILPWLKMGGADKFNLDLLTQLTRRGWDVTVTTTRPADHVWLPEFTRYTPDVFCLDKFLRLQDYPRFLLYLMQSRGITHVLVSNSQLGYELLPMIRAHYPQAAVLDYNHLEEPHFKDGGYPAMGAQWTDSIDYHGVTSKHLRLWCINRGVQPDKIAECYINIDPDEWNPDRFDRDELKHRFLDPRDPPERPVICWAARMTDQKRPMLLMEILRRLRDAGCDFATLIAGDGEDRSDIEKFIATHDLSQRIRLLGPLCSEDVQKLLAISDILLLPSKAEGIAMIIYEAMAMGVIPVSSVVGGQAELVTPDTGFLIPLGEPEQEIHAYLDALEKLIDDPALRSRMGQAARQRIVENFRLDQMGERMGQFLQKAADNHRDHPLPIMPLGLASQCAAVSIERYRLELLADHLWAQREQQHQPGGSATGHPSEIPMTRVRAELDYIENSRSWQTIQRFKLSWLYRAFAYLVHGNNSNIIAQLNDPREKLAAIKQSRFYRLLQAIKRTAPYKAYARRKYGQNFVNPWS